MKKYKFSPRRASTYQKEKINDLGLVSWEEVAQRFNEMSGEKLSRERVRQIAVGAENKIALALEIVGLQRMNILQRTEDDELEGMF